MSDKLILEVFVDVDFKCVSQLEGDAGDVVMIPFGGTAKGEIFSGTVLPGGTDTQTVDLNGVRHMSARYTLEGTDSKALAPYLHRAAFRGEGHSVADRLVIRFYEVTQ